MAKEKRLGSDPLSWIKDSRNEEEEGQNPENEEKQTEEKREGNQETETEPETTADKIETEENDEENVDTQDGVQEDEEEDEEELIAEDVLLENDEPSQELSANDIVSGIESVDEDVPRDQKQIIIFRLNNELYGIDIKEVKEIVHHRTITALPSAPDAVAGTINLRKQVISVLNLKKRLDMKDADYEEGCPIIILQNQEHLTGILVDEVREVSYVNHLQIEEAPEGGQDKLITGIIKMPNALISLIDSKKISLQHEFAREQESDVVNTLKEKATEEAAVDVGQFVGFFIRDDEFGVDIREIQEINKLVPITEVPRSPQFVEGVINLRGQIVPVIDLRVRFNIERKEYDKKTRIIVINVNNKKIGLIVDSVSEVLRISLSDIQDPPAEAVREGVEFIKGIAEINDRLVVILDLKSILTQNQIKDIGIMKDYRDAAQSKENNLESELDG